MSKKKKIIILVVLLFLLGTVAVVGMQMAYAYYTSTVTGVFSAETSDFEGEVDVVSGTHVFVPQSPSPVDTIEFYVRNYTGSDSSAVLSEVNSRYTLSFTLPTWGSGCSNPISYKLYRVNSSNEEEVSLTNNTTGYINFSMSSAEKHQYRLELYWNMSMNSASCYAGKSGNVGIKADIIQRT